MGDFRAEVVVASRSISRGLGLIFGLTLLAMTNEWGDTVFEESVLVGKLGLCLSLVIPLTYHDPLGLDPQFPGAHFLHVDRRRLIFLHLLIHDLIILDTEPGFQLFLILFHLLAQPIINNVEIISPGLQGIFSTTLSWYRVSKLLYLSSTSISASIGATSEINDIVRDYTSAKRSPSEEIKGDARLFRGPLWPSRHSASLATKI